MKKKSILSMLIILFFFIVSCNSTPLKENNIETKKEPKIESIYIGFKTLSNQEISTFPKKTLVFTSEPEFQIFINKYLPNIPCNTSIDFNKFFIIYDSNLTTKNNYTILKRFKGIHMIENTLSVDYQEENGNETYIENIHGFTNYSINLLKISIDDVSKRLDNFYHLDSNN